MLRDRVLSAVVLLPIVVVCLLLGGWAYTLLVTLVLELAAWEYQDLLRRNSYRPSRLMLGLGTAFWPLLFALQGEKWAAPGLFALAIAGAFWQMRHHDTLPSASWALTLAGSTYLGLGGAYLIKLRAMPDGLWWSLTAGVDCRLGSLFHRTPLGRAQDGAGAQPQKELGGLRRRYRRRPREWRAAALALGGDRRAHGDAQRRARGAAGARAGSHYAGGRFLRVHVQARSRCEGLRSSHSRPWRRF